jgi:putative peptidoglycan binding protein
MSSPKRHANINQAKARQRPVVSYADAVKRQHRERHSQIWWRNNYKIIVFVTGCGYYYWDAGYWFPALGYYPSYEYFDWDGPIYTYGELLPDQVIYNVQKALKELGYYSGSLTGSLSAALRSAIAAFQQDNELEASGAIDEPTVQALGLI